MTLLPIVSVSRRNDAGPPMGQQPFEASRPMSYRTGARRTWRPLSSPHTKEGLTMGVVDVDISMSVDGFITGPNERGAGLGEGGEPLHAWVWPDPDGPRLLDHALSPPREPSSPAARSTTVRTDGVRTVSTRCRCSCSRIARTTWW